jgi:hypothetical protein
MRSRRMRNPVDLAHVFADIAIPMQQGAAE